MKSPIKLFLTLLVLALLFSTQGHGKGEPLPEFKDVRKETQKFIEYFYTIKLSPSEQKVLERALKPLPAPCCADSSALTC